LATAHDVSVTFAAYPTECIITYMTPTEIRCVTEPFETSARRRNLRGLLAATDLVVTIGAASSPETGLQLGDTDVIVESITPNSASPILHETLLIQLSGTYDNTDMATDKFTVSLYPQDPENTYGNVHIEVTDHERFLNVIAQSEADRTITVKYIGAYSGVYDLRVHSERNGNVLTSSVTFTAKIEVTGFEPRQGSLYGGTLLTISGGHFGTEATDNPVKVGYEYSSGVDHYCYVISS
jgi:hypothetical protein